MLSWAVAADSTAVSVAANDRPIVAVAVAAVVVDNETGEDRLS